MYFFKDRLDNYFLELYIDLINQLFFFFSFLFFFFFFFEGGQGQHLFLEAVFLFFTSRKPVRCIGKLLKIKSKLIWIPFTSFVEYVFFFFLFCSSKCCRQDR
jgi:hypothetical protein